MNTANTLFLTGLMSLSSISLAFAKISDTRQQQETVRGNLTMSQEIGVGALFFPLLKWYEEQKLFSMKYDTGREEDCAVFTSNYVYSDIKGGLARVTSTLDGRGHSATFDEGAYRVLHPHEPIITLTGAKHLFGPPAFPLPRLNCLAFYANVVDNAVRLMLTHYGDHLMKNPYGEAVYVIADLETVARNAMKAGEGRTVPSQGVHKGPCTVPTAHGLQQGANDVRCGIWSFKSQGGDPTLEKSGVKWLAQDYIMGRKVLFVEGRGTETATTQQIIRNTSKPANKVSR